MFTRPSLNKNSSIIEMLSSSMAPASNPKVPSSGLEARYASRDNTWDGPTCGVGPGYLQANLIVLPSKYAADFQILCARNTVPCPLLAQSASPGDFRDLISHVPGIANGKIAADIDVRTDAPRYNVYKDGTLVEQMISDIKPYWTDDHVAFLIGCSYSFETALSAAGLTPPHVLHGRNVPMYRTTVPLCPAGVFQGGTYVVSMRMYRAEDVEQVREITRPYVTTHGEPIAWGWDGMKRLGILDVGMPDWGDAPVTPKGQLVEGMQEDLEADGFVPVFWGCGVTPQEAVMRAEIPGIVMGHAPGYMIVLDVKEDDVIKG